MGVGTLCRTFFRIYLPWSPHDEEGNGQTFSMAQSTSSTIQRSTFNYGTSATLKTFEVAGVTVV